VPRKVIQACKQASNKDGKKTAKTRQKTGGSGDRPSFYSKFTSVKMAPQVGLEPTTLRLTVAANGLRLSAADCYLVQISGESSRFDYGQ
jgi:hypothetical protein